MTLDSIRKKAKAERLEVEHILQAAARRLPGLDDALENLISVCGWTDGGALPNGEREIPFRKWAITAITFLCSGFDGLHQLGSQGENYTFVLALLRELHYSEAVAAAMSLRPQVFTSPAAHPDDALLLASTFDMLRSFKPHFDIARSQADDIRGFLHRLLPACGPDGDRSTVVLALRGVGDASSIALIATQPAFQHPFERVLSVTTKAIKMRLRRITPEQDAAPKSLGLWSLP